MFIETFVFFDIETTGLPHLERNKTKITELTFIAVSRRDIEVTSLHNKPCISKLSLLFNPERSIQPASVHITGLSNVMLENQLIFKNGIKTINSFLGCFKKPICLVAHNGNVFDYKILKAEYSDANEQVPEDIYCVDSLQGFRKILKGTNLYNDNLNRELLNINYEEVLTDDEDEDWPSLDTSIEDWKEIDKLIRLNINCDNIKSEANAENSHTMKVKDNFSLVSLYKRLTNKNVNGAHRAEVDCLMLLECVVAAKTHFLPWADEHCKLISNIVPLKRYH